MKIKFDTQITDLNGTPLSNGQASITLAHVAVDALLVADPAMTATEKVRNFELATRINAGGEVDLKPEEIALVKKCVGETMTTLVVGQAFRHLDG